jgi:uncharacterized protein involved in exopolysaccharide biosynthesis/Mrp family chromosome partitioning ATPase
MKDSRVESNPGGEHPSFNVNEILVVLFKHKWKILVSAAVGLIAAAIVYFLQPPAYVSQAKLLVRYVVDKSAVDSFDSATGTASGRFNDGMINSEVEILTSWDLAVEVAQRLGARRLLPAAGDAATLGDAAGSISSGLKVASSKGSNVISVSYQNRNPELAVLVLNELVESYFKKHLDVHRSKEAFDFVSQQTLLWQGSLRNTEEELKQRKEEAKVMSLPESITGIHLELTKTRDNLNSAEAELAEQRAVVKQMESMIAATTASNLEREQKGAAKKDSPVRQADNGDILQYQAVVKSLSQLRDLQVVLVSKYTEENQLLKINRAQIDGLEKQRRELEARIPGIATKVEEKSVRGHSADPSTERARLAGLEARVEVLKARLQDAEARAKSLSASVPKIEELERRKQLEETNYKTSAASLEKARIDEALDPSKIPNISKVQTPSPAARDMKQTIKLVLGLAFGGLAFGVALALLIELLLDRSIKRPLELESILGIPLMLSIPNVNGRPRLSEGKKRRTSGKERGLVVTSETAPWEVGHFIRHYAESIRDRLLLYFQLNGMVHKPKLVAVTGLLGGEGASTIAGGLASALSETGDGKVLLVDMNPANAGAHPFFRGKPTCSIPEALQANGTAAAAADNLYLATSAPDGEGSHQMLPKRFYDLVPNFKASDFDYIIFDMPPLNQSSATLAMAGSMDKVLLVVEAETGSRDTMKRACAELVAARARVSGIFNKTRSYGPKWADQELPGSITVPCLRSAGQAEDKTHKKPIAALRAIFWVALFVGSAFCSFVAFQHGFANFGDNVRKEVESLKSAIGLVSSTASARATPDVATPR